MRTFRASAKGTSNAIRLWEIYKRTDAELRSGAAVTFAPEHPEASGLIERLVLTLKREWLIWKDPGTCGIQAGLEEFKWRYNEDREHEDVHFVIAILQS